MRLWLVILLGIMQFGCATPFYGNAKIEGGPAGCQKICADWGMTLAGMVALGEYTDGCICQTKESKLSLKDVGETLLQSGAGGVGGIKWAQEGDELDMTDFIPRPMPGG